MLLDFQKLGEIPWKNICKKENSVILQGKKSRHLIEIMAILALNGHSTTREMAKFVLEKLPNYEYRPPRNKESSILEKQYYRLLNGIEKKKTGGKKSNERYPWPLEKGYVSKTQIMKNEKNRHVQKYFLTLKGCFFALGFNFDKYETVKFLENAARNHLFFAYVLQIIKNTSYSFTKKIFLKPISDMIKDENIHLDKDISFYFSNIAEVIGRSLIKFGSDLENFKDPEHDKKERYVKEIERWTFYDDRPTHDWPHVMTDIFYPDDDDYEFFEKYAHRGSELNLLYKVMQKIHLVYFGYEGNYIPRTTQRIPSSKSWKEYQKYHPEYKGPRDYDKKRKIKIRYDADFIPI